MKTGEVFTKIVFDREKQGAYALEVEARDGAPSARPNSNNQPNSGEFLFLCWYHCESTYWTSERWRFDYSPVLNDVILSSSPNKPDGQPDVDDLDEIRLTWSNWISSLQSRSNQKQQILVRMRISYEKVLPIELENYKRRRWWRGCTNMPLSCFQMINLNIGCSFTLCWSRAEWYSCIVIFVLADLLGSIDLYFIALVDLVVLLSFCQRRTFYVTDKVVCSRHNDCHLQHN